MKQAKQMMVTGPAPKGCKLGVVRLACRAVLQGDYQRARTELRHMRSLSVTQARALGGCLLVAHKLWGAPSSLSSVLS